MGAKRRRMVAGNWKMNPTLGRGLALAREVVERTRDVADRVDVVICPPAPFLAPIAGVIGGTHVALGAQNVHPDKAGAYTGEVAAMMLGEVGVRYVLCGHSERRQLFGESPEFVGAKVQAAHRDGLIPILCVGETLEEREAGETEAVVLWQLEAGLAGLHHAQVAAMVIAYEPVWAIGTGRNATPEQAQAVHARIRQWLGGQLGAELADEVRILYGGSIKASNAVALFAGPDIDGGLVGGASLEADGFAAIVRA